MWTELALICGAFACFFAGLGVAFFFQIHQTKRDMKALETFFNACRAEPKIYSAQAVDVGQPEDDPRTLQVRFGQDVFRLDLRGAVELYALLKDRLPKLIN